MTGEQKPQQDPEAVREVQRNENPITDLTREKLKGYVDELWEKKLAKSSYVGCVTYQELLIGAAHAKFYLAHEEESDVPVPIFATNGKDYNPTAKRGKALGPREWKAFKTQEDPKFWHEPKDLVVTLMACCLASFTQGWDQVANGNLGWPGAFDLNINNDGSGGKNGGTGDFWIVGGVNCITWFSAAFLGPFFVDPLAQVTDKLGRRGAVLIAALFSLASMIGGSRSTSWQGYLIARLFLGIGIGAKASLVPIWESEVLPPAKRGRLLVSWQFFTATGIFAGSVATYIFRTNWRNQVLSGALPALVLLIVTYFGTESPRYLILHGKHQEAFEALLRLRGERILAAEELCYIHFLIQAERGTMYADKESDELGLELAPLGYWNRLKRIPGISRNRYAAVATMVVMLSQQLSGINILGFVSSIFFFAAGLRKQVSPTDTAENLENAYDSLRFSIGFGLANAIFSAFAYFIIEPISLETDVSPRGRNAKEEPKASNEETKDKPISKRDFFLKLIRGRRALLMTSLGGGSLMLFILTFLLRLDASNDAKMPLVMVFIILWTLFYSPGAGCVPFLYSAEVWPNEGREVGMSWAVFCNFIGAGFLALFIPRGLKWGPPKLFGLFTGLSLVGVILVYLFVPATDRAKSLEAMSKKFDKKDYREFNKEKMKTLINPIGVGKRPRSQVPPGAPSASASATADGPASETLGATGGKNEQGTPGTAPPASSGMKVDKEESSDDEEEDENAGPSESRERHDAAAADTSPEEAQQPATT